MMAMPVYGINGAGFKNIRVRTETDFPARTFAQNKKHMVSTPIAASICFSSSVVVGKYL
jgi:hypothetical protein